MTEKVWYLYQNNQQAGPFDAQQVAQLYNSNMIAKDGYIFRVGWKDWRPLEESLEALGLGDVPPSPTVRNEQTDAPEKRTKGAPRATIAGRVVVHNNTQLTIGQGVNISASGIFVETNQPIFTVGERLKLSVRCKGFTKSFNAEATVIRFNSDGRFSIGYGLKFDRIEKKDQEQIQRLVDEANKRGDRGQLVAR